MSSNDRSSPPDLAALIGSRICHDLISPVGAIGNGLELLSMSGSSGPEVSLISESVNNANARIRFFRIAFGVASADQATARSEILSILRDVYGETRINIDWGVTVDCRRSEAKAAFLTLQCLESALPYGGDIHVTRSEGSWHFIARSGKLKADPALWGILEGTGAAELDPKHVHFLLLPPALGNIGRSVKMHRDDESITLSF